MRVTIVDPTIDVITKEGLKLGSRLGKENLGAHYVYSYLASKGHKVSFIRTERPDVDEAVGMILSSHPEGKPEVVAMGPYTYNFPFALEIAARLKQRDIIIVFGHVHAALAPETIPEQYYDYIIMGEAEWAFNQLIRKLENGDRPDRLVRVPLYNGELDRLPFPYRDRRLLGGTPLFFHPPGLRIHKVALVLGSRGCAAHCDFCVTPELFGHGGVVHRSPEKIIAELNSLQDRFGEDIVFHFVDPLFNANERYPRELAQAMIQSGRQYWCTAMCDFHNLDRELIRLLKRAGFYWLLFGIETFDDEERRNMGKRRGNADEVLRLCFEEGILTRGFIMLGFPETTRKTLEYQRQALWERQFIGNPRMNFCVPFPGTGLYKRAERKRLLLTHNWESFTTEEPVIRCHVQPSELLDFRQSTSEAYYQSDKYRRSVAQQIRKFPELEEVYADAFAQMGLLIRW